MALTKEMVKNKFYDIATDLSCNVTKIYGREDMLIAADLVFHSILDFTFRGKRIEKGWTEAVIIGDTRAGKSESLKQLIRHYKVGEFITGEDLSIAGLVGGLQQIGNRWNITWGKLVLQNRRAAVLDEVNNLDIEAISSMSGFRSSGIAEITKIQHSRTEARVRQLWLGNPRSNRFLNSYSHGIVALKELIGKLDDIARFDLGVACAIEEVSPEIYNSESPPSFPHKYTSQVCHDLIMWAWSRKPSNVKWMDDADLAVLQYAQGLSNTYTSQVPLVNSSEMRIKLARLSVAAAARLFSTDDTYENVLVYPAHVEFVDDFLRQCYNKSSMGYDEFTKIKRAELQLNNAEEIKEKILQNGSSLLEGLLEYEYLSQQDIMDFTGWDRDESKNFMSFLVMNKCIKKFSNNSYIKTPAFNILMRNIKKNKPLNTVEVSDINEEEELF